MRKQALKYVAVIFFAGMVSLGVPADAPLRDGVGLLLAASVTAPSTGDALSPCPDTFMDPETEGPYYKTGSPERRDLIEAGIPGEVITLTGYVFDRDCIPIAGAWIDFWQADGSGAYDNQGYKLRGHQVTDKDGKYMLRTVIPGEYPGRTNHIHVKVRGRADGPVITSQLYFPGSRLNTSDRIFHPTMLVTLQESSTGEKRGFFSFRLNQ